MAREILAIQGLDKTSDDFKRGLISIADERGLNPSYLAAVIAFESGFDPKAVNPYSGCVGLIQFCKPSRDEMGGITREEILALDEIGQLPLVSDHYRIVQSRVKRPIVTPEDHYLAVFYPDGIGKQPGDVMIAKEHECTKPLKGAYCQNRGFDTNNDGTILVSEATAPVVRLVEEAKTKPPIVVGGAPPIPTPGGIPLRNQLSMGEGAIAFFGAMAVGLVGYDYLLKKKRHQR